MVRRWALLVLVSGCVYAQPSLGGPSYTPANLWMTYPIPWIPGNDQIPGSVRQQRDQYFDESIGLRTPLTPANAKGSGFSEGVRLPNQTEIPELPNRRC